MNQIRVATWNVLYRDRAERIGLIAAHLVAVRPDVVLLQEIDHDHAYDLAGRLDLDVAAVGIDAQRGFGVAVLWSHDLERGRAPLHEPAAAADAMYAEALTHVGSTTVRFASVHLDATPDAWRLALDANYRRSTTEPEQVGAIADASIRESVSKRLRQLDSLTSFRAANVVDAEILAGDFNCLPHGIEYNAALAWGLSDAWTAGPRIGTGATILSRNPLIGDGEAAAAQCHRAMPGFDAAPDYTLDLQLHTPNLTPCHAWTFGEPSDGSWASDHLGISVDYQLPGLSDA